MRCNWRQHEPLPDENRRVWNAETWILTKYVTSAIIVVIITRGIHNLPSINRPLWYLSIPGNRQCKPRPRASYESYNTWLLRVSVPSVSGLKDKQYLLQNVINLVYLIYHWIWWHSYCERERVEFLSSTKHNGNCNCNNLRKPSNTSLRYWIINNNPSGGRA